MEASRPGSRSHRRPRRRATGLCGRIRARNDARPNRAQPSENSTTLTSQAVHIRLPDRSGPDDRRGRDLGEPRHGESLEPHVAGQGDGSGGRGAERDRSESAGLACLPPYTATKAINSNGNAMAYAALNGRNSGSFIMATRSLWSPSRNIPTWATANSPPALTAIGPACVLSGDSDMSNLRRCRAAGTVDQDSTALRETRARPG